MIALQGFGFTAKTTVEKIKSRFDRIEKYGNPERVYVHVKANRIVGVQFLADQSAGHSEHYAINEDCEVESITASHIADTKLQSKINSKVCSHLGILSSRMSGLPTEPRRYEDACRAMKGKMTANTQCECLSTKMKIDPYVATCDGVQLPESKVKNFIEKNGGFVDAGLKPRIQRIIDLCAQNSAVFQKFSSSSRVKTLSKPARDNSAQ